MILKEKLKVNRNYNSEEMLSFYPIFLYTSRYLYSVDSRNFEMWGQFSPMSEKCGGLVNKMGTCTSAKEGLISEAFVCPYVC